MKHPNFTIATEIQHALNLGAPIVALESTVITHGLPRPVGTIPNQYNTPYPPYPNTGTVQPKFDARVDYDFPDVRTPDYNRAIEAKIGEILKETRAQIEQKESREIERVIDARPRLVRK